ncbi:MAG: type VI secretion system tip protein TssI/VgrG [Nibricoccus sp.]
MCAQPTQKNRTISIKTPLGDDKLLLTRFEYKEQLNVPFVISAEVLSTEIAVPFNKIVGHPVTISMGLGSGAKRYFHGIVSDFAQVDRTVGAAMYHMTIRPWLYHLGNASDCQIFQQESIPEILQKVIKKAGFTDLEVKLTETYAPLEYCVQYRETHLNFITRLLAKAGICYYHKHEENRHVLVLTDAVKSHAAYPGYDSVVYREASTTGSLVESIQHWTSAQSAKTGKYVQTDFDFKRPKADLLVNAPISRSHGLADFEKFDYPGEYDDTGAGQSYAKARIEGIQSAHEVVRGQGSSRGLAPGFTFKLKDHPRADQNREYLFTFVWLSFNAGGFTAGTADLRGDGQEAFDCIFEAIPTTQQYRPSLFGHRPRITGPQTAIVTGPSGEEIHTDEHGRVKVHFHWDRYGKFDADSSCWIRVSQYWAGKGWGAMHIPRIGQEVIVEFLEGDPDRPIITGRVYNGEERPPYALPANKNISTLMSRSTKGGGTDNFNEVKMDDSKGKELLYVQAEKDRTVLVKNDNTETVKHDESVDIGNNRKKHVQKNEDVSIGQNRTEDVGKNEKISIGENRTEDVGKNEQITIGQNRKEEVGKNEEVKIGENRSVQIGKNDKLVVGKQLFIDAGDQITIQTGASSIVMKKDGTIQIKGKDISVIGSGGINVKATGNLILKGAKITEN